MPIITAIVFLILGGFVGYKLKIADLRFKKQEAEKVAREEKRKKRQNELATEQAARDEKARKKQEKRQSERKEVWDRFFPDPEEHKKALSQFLEQVCSERGEVSIESLREEAFHMQFSLDDLRAADALAKIEGEAYRRLRESIPQLDHQLTELEERWKKEG